MDGELCVCEQPQVANAGTWWALLAGYEATLEAVLARGSATFGCSPRIRDGAIMVAASDVKFKAGSSEFSANITNSLDYKAACVFWATEAMPGDSFPF